MIFLFLPLILLEFLTGCQRLVPSAGVDSRPGGLSASPPMVAPLRIQLGGTPISMDPALAEDGLSLRVLANVMDGLVGYDGAGTLKFLLAESVRQSPDHKRFEFTLRSGIQWSDGRPVMPGDFVRGIRRSLAPGTASRLADFLEVILGAQAYRQGRSTELPGVTEKDGKVIFQLERPISYFLQLMTLPVALPIREDVLEKNQGRWPEGEKQVTVPVTGPYRFAEYAIEKKIRLERNPNYWQGPAPVAQAEFVIVSDESTGVNLFDSERLDILTRVPGPDFHRWRKKGRIWVGPFFATNYIGFNLGKPPFDRASNRRAFSRAIRREELVQTLMTGEAPARGWISQGMEGFIGPEEPVSSQTKSAHRLSEAATVLKGFAVRSSPIVLEFDSSERNRLIAEKVEQDIREGLGIRLSLVNQDWKTHVRTVQTNPPATYRFAWQSPISDPAFLLGLFTTRNSNNFSKWSQSNYDRLVGEIEVESPGPARERKIRMAQKILVEDEAVIAPLYHYVQVYAVGARVTHFRANPFGVIRLNELEVHDGGHE